MLLQAIVLVLVASGTLAYPNGPPVASNPDICTTMAPKHNASAKTTESPFEIKVTGADNCYNAAITLTVQVKTKIASNESYFEGFFLIARPLNADTPDTSTAVGTFEVGSDPDLQTLDCFNTAKSSAGQAQKAHYDSKVVKWTDSSNATLGDKIQFVATFVKETEEYWLNVKSAVVTYDPNCTATAPTGAPTTTTGNGVAMPTLEVAMIVFSAAFLAFFQF